MKLLLLCCLLVAVVYCEHENSSSENNSTTAEPKTMTTMSQRQHQPVNESNSVSIEESSKMEGKTEKPTPAHGASIKGNGNGSNLISITPFLFVLSALGFVF